MNFFGYYTYRWFSSKVKKVLERRRGIICSMGKIISLRFGLERVKVTLVEKGGKKMINCLYSLKTSQWGKIESTVIHNASNFLPLNFFTASGRERAGELKVNGTESFGNMD